MTNLMILSPQLQPKEKAKVKATPPPPQPISDKRKADVMANKKAIMDQGLCFNFNLGKCSKTAETCSHKHKYFSLKSLSAGGSKPQSPRAATPPKQLSEEEKLARSKLPCPFHARGKCSFGDKCHYSHTAPLNGGVAQAGATIPGTVAVLTACASMPTADAVSPTFQKDLSKS